MEKILTNSKNNRSITIFALALLLFSRWLFYHMELNAETNILCYVLEELLFLSIYVMYLLHVPKSISVLWLILGCVGMGFYYGFQIEASVYSIIVPFTYFPTFLFLIDQSSTSKKSEGAGSWISKLIYFYPLFLFAAILYTVINKRPSFFQEDIYCIIAVLLISIIYGFVLRTPLKKQQKAVKSENVYDVQQMKTVFFFSIVIILGTSLYSLFNHWIALARTLSVLWLVNLLLLYDQGHPLVCACAERFRQMMTSKFI